MQIDISKPEGNAYSILGLVKNLLTITKRDDEWFDIEARMKSGDYDNLCKVATEVSNGSITFFNSNDEEDYE